MGFFCDLVYSRRLSYVTMFSRAGPAGQTSNNWGFGTLTSRLPGPGIGSAIPMKKLVLVIGSVELNIHWPSLFCVAVHCEKKKLVSLLHHRNRLDSILNTNVVVRSAWTMRKMSILSAYYDQWQHPEKQLYFLGYRYYKSAASMCSRSWWWRRLQMLYCRSSRPTWCSSSS